MKTADPEDIQGRVIARLREKGPATATTLASELNASQLDIQSALDDLSDTNSVRILFGGLWDVHWAPPNQK